MKRESVNLISALVVALVFALAQGCPSQPIRKECSCGMLPSRALLYSGPPADVASPEPRVVRLTLESPVSEDVEVRFWDTRRNGASQVEIQTHDGGRTWTRHEAEDGSVDGGSAIGYRMSSRGILEWSNDAGKVWQASQMVVNGAPEAEFASLVGGGGVVGAQVGLAAIHPADPRTIYGCFRLRPRSDSTTGMPLSQPQNVPGVYVSHDMGNHWTLFTSQLQGFSSEEGYCPLGIDPLRPNVLIGQGWQGPVVSRDSGRSWSAVGQQAELNSSAVLKAPAGTTARLRSDGTSVVERPSWSRLTITDIRFAGDRHKSIYMMTNKGLYKSEDDTRTWCLLNTGESVLFELGSLFISDVAPERLFVGTRSKILESTDGGCDFHEFFDAQRFIQSLREKPAKGF